LLLWLAWACVAVLFAAQVYLIERAVHRSAVEWWRPFAIQLLCHQFWFLLTPLVLLLGRRFPLERSDWQASLVVHAAASAAVPAVYLLACQSFVLHWLRPEATRPPTLATEYLFTLVSGYPIEFLTYWAVIGIQHGVRVFREHRERELQVAHTQARLAEARLLALTMQLQPHFLFNTLNAISALIHEDPDAADRMLARLGDLLRLTLLGGEQAEVPLRQELELLKRYLAIEEVRFADRLRVRLDVAPAALDARVPSLLLQPLVENAIRHGIARRGGRGRLDVSGSVDDARLRLVVRNDGPALQTPLLEGLGLRNTRARLEELYGAEQLLAIENDPAGGVRTLLQLPFRRAAP
jgi:two-component system LytT family sensor kinase